MHSGDLTELEVSELSQQEKDALKQVMERAKQFDKDTATSLAAPPEGVLLKWTNPLKGWQQRWFCVDQQQGVLHYYMSEDRKKFPPRGSLHLWGAMVAPSEEDSQSFSISGSNGEVYKLKAADAKERQFWVSRVRREVQACTDKNSRESTKQSVPRPLSSHLDHSPDSLTTPHTTPTRALSKRLHSLGTRLKPPVKGSKVKEEQEGVFPGGDAMREVFSRLQCYQENMEMQIDTYSRQSGLDPLDKNVLLLRATSKAAVCSVKDCLSLLKVYNEKYDQDGVSTTSIGDGDNQSLKSSPGRHSLVDPVTGDSASNQRRSSTASSRSHPATS